MKFFAEKTALLGCAYLVGVFTYIRAEPGVSLAEDKTLGSTNFEVYLGLEIKCDC